MQRLVYLNRDRCIGCDACIVACKLEHNLPPYPEHPPVGNPLGPARIRVDRVGPEIRDGQVHQYYQPALCVHCRDAPCITVCPESALHRDAETGIVRVDREQCMGCRSCAEACPYAAPQFYDEKLHLCDLCFDRPEERRQAGRYTACEAACPARVISVVLPSEDIPHLPARRITSG